MIFSLSVLLRFSIPNSSCSIRFLFHFERRVKKNWGGGKLILIIHRRPETSKKKKVGIFLLFILDSFSLQKQIFWFEWSEKSTHRRTHTLHVCNFWIEGNENENEKFKKKNEILIAWILYFASHIIMFGLLFNSFVLRTGCVMIYSYTKLYRPVTIDRQRRSDWPS